MDSYASLVSNLRMRYVPALLELYSDSVITTWGDVAVRGMDDVVKNWQRIVIEARVDQAPRVIVSSTTLGAGMLRDSGTIVFRIRNAAGGPAFSDSTMRFVTRWVREKKPSRWVIAADSIMP